MNASFSCVLSSVGTVGRFSGKAPRDSVLPCCSDDNYGEKTGKLIDQWDKWMPVILFLKQSIH
jgi:hypothetical protein